MRSEIDNFRTMRTANASLFPREREREKNVFRCASSALGRAATS